MSYEYETSADVLEDHYFQGLEADLEMAEMEHAAAEAAYWRSQGFCDHPSGVGYLPVPVYPEQKSLKPGQMYCYECKSVVADPFQDDDEDEDY